MCGRVQDKKISSKERGEESFIVSECVRREDACGDEVGENDTTGVWRGE